MSPGGGPGAGTELVLDLLPGLLPHLGACGLLVALLARVREARGVEGLRCLARGVALALGAGALVTLALLVPPLVTGSLGGEVPARVGRALLTLALSLVYFGAAVRALHRLRVPLAGTAALLAYPVGLVLEVLATGGMGPAIHAWWRPLLPPAGFLLDAPDLLLRGVAAPSMAGWTLLWCSHLTLFLAVQLWPGRPSQVSAAHP